MIQELLQELNSKQQQAVTHPGGPALIFAGAGSGKTRVLTYRAIYLAREKHVPASQILMVTFTNKAANEMKQRVLTIIGSGATPVAGTFHSICAKILRIDGKTIGIASNFVIYDTQDQLDLIKEIMKQLDISAKNTSASSVLHTISAAKNELISSLAYPQYARGYFQETVASIYIEYQKALNKNQAVDFDDLLGKTVELFQESSLTLGRYQEQFQNILVDEYQDTNKAQYLLTKMLSARYKNIYVVGDASQSIYRWRGADFRNITNFKSDYPETKEYHLEQNYRSTERILTAAYGVISKNTSHPILKLWTENKGGNKLTLYEARNEQDEAKFIATTILQSGRPFSDFAVLYRTNAQSRTIEEAFLHLGVPYVLVGGTRFYERKEIKDVLAYLRLVVNPKDTVSERRVEKLGKGRFQRFKVFADDIQADNTLIKFTTLEILDAILETTQYIELYDANVEEEAYRLENIKELRSVATEFPDMSEFLTNVALIEQDYQPKRQKELEANRKTVTLMTLHAAKGLEFHSVFMVGMEEGLFPHSRTLMDKEELEEERRLCYVGITRAKESLYLTYANRRLYFGVRTQNMISRFISDIPEDTIQFQVSMDADRGFIQEDYLL